MAQKRNKRSKAEPTPMILYHYTSWYHMMEIIASGHITRAPSNLLKPKNPFIDSGTLVDPETDEYKPVIWLTDSESPERLGIDGPPPEYSKKRVRFSIPMQPHFTKWDKWAKRNKMDTDWKRCLTSGMNWKSWYISEKEIPLENVSQIFDLENNTIIRWK